MKPCRCCGAREDLTLPKWHPVNQAGPRPRSVTLRIWVGRHLRVCSVDEILCERCADEYGKRPKRAEVA
jgi:hypothetical protein